MIKNELTIIAAASTNNVIGLDNKLIWNIPKDLKRFKELTQGHNVIMGRKTFESLPNPLPNRVNIVVTRNAEYKYEGVIICKSIIEALEHCKDDSQTFILGGGEIYKLGFKYVDKLYITEIYSDINGNTYFPKWNKENWKEISRISYPKDEKHEFNFDYVIYKKSE